MKYRRKPEVVDARQVTPENAAEVVAWCGGVVDHDRSLGLILRAADWEWTVAVGDWIVRDSAGIVSFHDSVSFRQDYEPVPETSLSAGMGGRT